jgi:hypothetical protein
MIERKLNAYVLTENERAKYIVTTIYAPCTRIALEWAISEARGEFVKIEKIKSDFVVLDYTDIENEDNCQSEIKYLQSECSPSSGDIYMAWDRLKND